jgi:hypothetical protein
MTPLMSRAKSREACEKTPPSETGGWKECRLATLVVEGKEVRSTDKVVLY